MLELYKILLEGDLEYSGSGAQELPDPVGVGAVGGSGTRLLAQILSASAVAMARPINPEGDALEWPPFKMLLSPPMLARYPRELILRNAFHTFESLLVHRRAALGLAGRAGWKLPTTFHWLEELASFFPGFQYIHLVRNGLDMAYSGNQTQIKNWAGNVGMELEYTTAGKVRPHSMLEYWLRANELALASGERYLPGRLLVVRFEELCATPVPVLRNIMQFLELDSADARLAEISQLVKEPDSIGRFRRYDWPSEFSADQLARLRQLGYSP